LFKLNNTHPSILMQKCPLRFIHTEPESHRECNTCSSSGSDITCLVVKVQFLYPALKHGTLSELPDSRLVRTHTRWDLSENYSDLLNIQEKGTGIEQLDFSTGYGLVTGFYVALSFSPWSLSLLCLLNKLGSSFQFLTFHFYP